MTSFEKLVHGLPEPPGPLGRQLTREEVERLYPGAAISEAYGKPVVRVEEGTETGHNGHTLGHRPEMQSEKASDSRDFSG